MIKIKKLTFKVALGLAALTLFTLPFVSPIVAADYEKELTLTAGNGTGDNRAFTSGSETDTFNYARANGTIGTPRLANIFVINDKRDPWHSTWNNNSLANITMHVIVESTAIATTNSPLAASLFFNAATGNNIVGGNVTLKNAATDNVNTNNTSMTVLTTDKIIIGGTLSITSIGSTANTTSFNAAKGTTQINSGSLTVKGFTGATVTNTKAEFLNLDFSNSTGANVNVENGMLKFTNLNIAGDKDNTFNFANINTELAQPQGILTVGNETIPSAGGILNIKSTTAATKTFTFSNAAFYLNGLAGGDVALTVTGLSNGVKTKMVDVSAINAGNVMLALEGNNLQKGETLTLITGDIIGNTSIAQKLTDANIITGASGALLNNGLYKASEYSVYWYKNSLILALAGAAMPNPDGALGSNTNNIWFKKLEALATTGADGSAYLTGDNLASLDGANNTVDTYNALSPNAKELYKDLTFKTEELGFDGYKWQDTPEANNSRQALDEYFGVVVPQLVTDYNATHGNQVSKDDYIIAFMNDLDPFIHTVGGLHISRVVVDSMDIILDNANTTNSSLAYAQSVAAGENTDYWRIWAKTSATWDKLANQGFYSGYTGSHFAGYLGGDRNFGNARLGLAIGAGKSKLDWDNNAKTEADNIIAKLYGEYDYNSFTFGASIGGGNTSVEAERYVAGTKRKADYDVSMFAFDVYSKYSHKTENFEFTPEIGLSYLKTKQDSFTERGAAGMYFDSLKNDSALAYLKVSANVPVELENGIILKPRASAGISHELADNNSTLRSSFIGQPGQYVNNKGPELKRTSVDVGVGLEANFTNDLSAYIQYDAQIQSDYKRQTASAGLEFRF